MALKDILVHLDAGEGSVTRLSLAMDLARRHSARLAAMFVDEWTTAQWETRATAEIGLASARDLSRLDALVTTDIERAATQLRFMLTQFQQQHGLEFGWLRSAGCSDTAVDRLVPYCDLCILGHNSFFGTGSVDRAFCERLVFSTVTPILLVPVQSTVTSLGKRIVVGWDSSRTAARALNDAIAFIEQAEQTTVVNVECGVQVTTDIELELLQARLRRHGSNISALRIRAAEDSVATMLQLKAHELEADLLVAGAFGHSRLKERIFGGVSRALLQNMTLPVLLSH